MSTCSNIYKVHPQHLREILAAYRLDELLYVPIDGATYHHLACVVNFFGDVLIPPFEIPATLHGIEFLLKKVTHAVTTTGAKKVFLGLEATGHYHEHLVLRLRALGSEVAVLNPLDTWREKENPHAKTDRVDLSAIARGLISQKGSRWIVADGIYQHLKQASRTRRKYVWMQTQTKHRITALVDRLFPGLWPAAAPIFTDPWGKASRLLVTHYPMPQQVLRLGEKRLAAFFHKHNTKLGLETAQRILQAAQNAPTRPEADLQVDLVALDCHLQTLTLVEEHLTRLEAQMARYLLATPGVYLLSVPGISMISAADFTAEVGGIQHFADAKQLIALAGTCSKTEQTGESDLTGLPISKQGRNLLRAILNQIALSLNAHCPDYTTYYHRKHQEKQDRPKIAAIATGNKFAHLAFALMK